MKKETQPEGNFYNKYESKNPVEMRIMDSFYNALFECVDDVLNGKNEDEVIRVLEAGCGEGYLANIVLSHLIEKGYDVIFDAFDISEKTIEQAKSNYPDINFGVNNVYDMNIRKKYDLVICSEVCEHLESPNVAIKRLSTLSDNIVITVPNEPLWRILNLCRLKYISRLGNTPGHIQHWNSRSFINLIKECKLDVRKVCKPIPFVVVACKRKSC